MDDYRCSALYHIIIFYNVISVIKCEFRSYKDSVLRKVLFSINTVKVVRAATRR